MKNRLSLLLIVSILFSTFRADKPVLIIFTIDDSVMANRNLYDGNPEHGWCMALPGFFSEGIRVDNHAVNGRNSKSLISEGRWAKVISQVKEGDYIFIQFGYNDGKADSACYTDPGTTFDDDLRRFVSRTRAEGGILVLLSSTVHRNLIQPEDVSIVTDTRHTPGEQELPKEGNVLYDTYGTYLDSSRNVAEGMGMAFIDMNKATYDLVQGLGPVESKKLFMFVEPEKVPAFPKDREDSTHLNAYGARTIAGLTVDAITKEIPELAKYVRHYDYVATQDETGDFSTAREAINAIPDSRKNMCTTALARKGACKEKIIVPESEINISLTGEDGVVLTNDDSTNKENVFDENMGTSGSSSCYAYAPDFYAENITFENPTGPAGQAVTYFIPADHALFKSCCFLGYQDILYTYGKHSRQYYEDCYIEGTIDFIFGWSVAVSNRCCTHSKCDGYVTAPSTDQGKKYGYVFYNYRLTANPDVAKVYLSRPWHPYVQTALIRCELGKHILPGGWHNWGKKRAEKTVFYVGYDGHGEGANPRAHTAFSCQLKNLRGYEVEAVSAGEDGRSPLKNDSAK